MLDAMDYASASEYMQRKWDDLKRTNRKFGQFMPYDGILIQYPGYKKKGDYRLTLPNWQGRSPTHINVCDLIYRRIMRGEVSFERVVSLLEHTYRYGTEPYSAQRELTSLQQLIFWITLQEEINYPRAAGYAGIKLPFCRYYEAAYCTKPDASFTLEDVKRRCNHHGGQRPPLYQIPGPSYYV